MDLTEAMTARRSVRAYTGEPLRAEDLASIRQFIAATRAPFGVRARIELVHQDFGTAPRKLGSYGTVKNARDFMGLIYEPGPLAEIGAAYWFEQAVLHCTAIGLGTCWLAGFTHRSFAGNVVLIGQEKLRIASPVGYAGGTGPMLQRLRLFDADRLHTNKKPFEELFFHPDFVTPLTPSEAADLAEPLRMARIAPSAKNRQPYRAVLDGNDCHFYTAPGTFADLDIGIALAHFALTCSELRIEGQLERVASAPVGAGLSYAMTWRRAT
ncbi:MAG: hypothetical protein LBJ08_01825 [Bifidobacteriaceae bacterium]|jgi:nitroreductase|nr:hypothetical protein [Bifidobacteriaceae bacterium]